jgi:5'-3' exonuclease
MDVTTYMVYGTPSSWSSTTLYHYISEWFVQIMVSVADTKLPYKNNIYSDPEPIIHSDTKP